MRATNQAAPLAEALRGLARGLAVLADALDTLPAPEPQPVETWSVGVAEAARRLGISDKGVRRLVARGAIRGLKLGARLVIPGSEISRVLTGSSES